MSMDNIFDVFNELPDGFEHTFEENGIKYYFKKSNGYIEARAVTVEEPEEEFDDSEVKEVVKAYMKSLDALEDDVFLDVVEEMSSDIDLKEFDSLLKQESFTKDEANKVMELIDKSSDIISHNLQDRILELINLCERF